MENLDENDKEHIKKHPSKPRRLGTTEKEGTGIFYTCFNKK